MFNKKLLIGLAILGGHFTNNQAISNGIQLGLASLSGITTGLLTNQLLLNKNLASINSNLEYLNPKIVTYSCALSAAALTTWWLYDATPGAKLKKARAINTQINRNQLMTIYANEADSYVDAIMHLRVRDDYPLLTAFQELELIDDLINEALWLLDQALDDAYNSAKGDIIWEQASFELLKQRVNDYLYFIKSSHLFIEQKNNSITPKMGSTNTIFLDIILK